MSTDYLLHLLEEIYSLKAKTVPLIYQNFTVYCVTKLHTSETKVEVKAGRREFCDLHVLSLSIVCPRLCCFITRTVVLHLENGQRCKRRRTKGRGGKTEKEREAVREVERKERSEGNDQRLTAWKRSNTKTQRGEKRRRMMEERRAITCDVNPSSIWIEKVTSTMTYERVNN